MTQHARASQSTEELHLRRLRRDCAGSILIDKGLDGRVARSPDAGTVISESRFER